MHPDAPPISNVGGDESLESGLKTAGVTLILTTDMNLEPRSSNLERSLEHELLLCCARSRLADDGAQRIRAALDRGIDWDRLLALATHHKVSGLLARHLTAMDGERVPPSVQARLAAVAEHIARRNLALTGELGRILELFKAREILGVPYKGPMLALGAYGDLALRQSVDLDVLVRRHDVQAAKQVLLGAGYTLNYALSPDQETTMLDSEYALEFRHPEKRLLFELHWDIARRYFSLPLESIDPWARLETLEIGGTVMRVPCWEDQLLLVCVHSSKHGWACLLWICDIAELLRVAPPAGVSAVMTRARQVGALRIVLLGLDLARRLLNAAVPPEALHSTARDRAIEPLAARVCARLFAPDLQPPSLAEQVRFHLAVRERLQDRVRYCLRALVTPTLLDAIAFPLPAYLSPLYWIARPARLIKKHLFRLW